MNNDNKMSLSEDEEDLEALRLAALQSLKKKNAASEESPQNNQNFGTFSQEHTFKHNNRPHGNYPGRRGRFFGGRGAKNGQFHGNRLRSANLISITPIGDPKEEQFKPTDPKLSLPQNTKSTEDSSKPEETSSKFDRYKDSDNSDEDSEDEFLKTDSEDDSPAKLLRADSLEALMQELDDEIQGRSKETEKQGEKCDKNDKSVKGKVRTKRKKGVSGSESGTTEEETRVETDKEETAEQEPSEPPQEVTPSITKEKPVEEPQTKKLRRTPPIPRKYSGFRGRGKNFRRTSPYRMPPFIPPTPTLPFIPSVPVFNPVFGPPNLVIPPPFPLSPLHINADTLQTQTMAPLSPRSAAFVLENRAIVEKRKRSPRRSYSRSPSRSLSPLSPRRSLSPRRRSRSPKRRSLSPKRRSFSPRPRQYSPRPLIPRQRPLSPKQRPFSPKRRSLSPRRRSLSPKRKDRKEFGNSPKPKPSVRERLGFKSKIENKDVKEAEIKDRNEENEKSVDPILEARKRKFESKEINVREGVIRLKPKEEKVEEKPVEDAKSEAVGIEPKETLVEPKEDIFDEEALLADDEIDLAPRIDLFSDEESGSDNEGRFKEKLESTAKPAVVPFSKLINGTKETSKIIPKKSSESLRKRSRSPHVKLKEETPSRGPTKKRIVLKSERHPSPKRFERKIEIKIKNPAKYEKEDSKKGKKEDVKKAKTAVRKVEVEQGPTELEDDFDTEIVVEADEDEMENVLNSEGDLRAQLSKKRAEKLHKTTITTEAVPSRLLQNALQNALPMKKPKKKKSKSRDLTSNELARIKSLFTADFIASRLQLTVKSSERHVTVYKSKKFKFGFERSTFSDGKIPIHLRLGLACSSEALTKSKKKSRKRKSADAKDQV